MTTFITSDHLRGLEGYLFTNDPRLSSRRRNHRSCNFLFLLVRGCLSRKRLIPGGLCIGACSMRNQERSSLQSASLKCCQGQGWWRSDSSHEVTHSGDPVIVVVVCVLCVCVSVCLCVCMCVCFFLFLLSFCSRIHPPVPMAFGELG